MDRVRLARDIDSRCRLEGEFTLRSGQVSSEYFDKYLFESDPWLLREVASEMVPLLPADTQLVAGLELGGVPIATIVSSLTGLPALFVRKEAKQHGTRRLAEGAEVQGRVVTLIEDVVTTAGAARQAAINLRDQGATVSALVCAINRSDAGSAVLGDLGLETLSVLTKADLDSARSS